MPKRRGRTPLKTFLRRHPDRFEVNGDVIAIMAKDFTKAELRDFRNGKLLAIIEADGQSIKCPTCGELNTISKQLKDQLLAEVVHTGKDIGFGCDHGDTGKPGTILLSIRISDTGEPKIYYDAAPPVRHAQTES